MAEDNENPEKRHDTEVVGFVAELNELPTGKLALHILMFKP